MNRLLAHNDLILVGLLVICLAGFGLVDPGFLALGNLFGILRQTAVVAIVAFGMTALIIGRGIDLSVGSTLAFAGIVGAEILAETGSALAALAATICAGAGVGLLNGCLVGLVGISPFMATLASMALARGLALCLSHASSIPVGDPWLLWAGAATLFGLPASILLAAGLLLVWWIVLGHSVFGRWIYATGGNRDAARASLIPVRRVEIGLYVLAGVSAGIGAVLTFGRLGSAQPLAGMGLEFSAITAAIIGGTKLAGGEGSVLGTALGALLLGIVNTGLSFLQVPQDIIYFITGGLIVLAVLISQPAVLAEVWSDGRAALRGGASLATPSAAPLAGAQRRLDISGLGKDFPGIKALDDIAFTLKSGEVVALAGENGAGKSTLVKCLSGLYRPDRGAIRLDGTEIRPGAGAEVTGIAVIHQHFSLVPHLTVTENLVLGREPRGRFGWLDRRRMAAEARRVFETLGLDIDPAETLDRLTVGQKQMVEIARAILTDAWLFIMDEPTSALGNRERDRLYDIIERLVRRGAGILYISHKMEEIFALSRRVLVLRDGRFVGERPTAETSESQLIAMMVGRDLGGVFPHAPCPLGEIVLEVEGLSDGGLLRDVSLKVRAGEIVALAGLMGSGRSEVLRAVAGLDPFRAGRVEILGRSLRSGDMRSAHAAGVALVPEDRHREGFVGPMSIRDNLGLVWMRRHAWCGLIDPRRRSRLGREMIAALGVRPPRLSKKTIELSGGNQQKVVIGKWLATGPRLLLLDEPTRGVDVGAKADLHALIAAHKASGVAILMVSSELPEVLGVADRIVVLHAGRVAGELPRGASEHQVTELAFGRPPSARHDHVALQGA